MIFPNCVQAICWQELRQPLTFSNWKCQAWAMSEFFFLRIFSNNYFCLFQEVFSLWMWRETFFSEEFILKCKHYWNRFELLSNIKTRPPVRLTFKIWTQNSKSNILMISSNSSPKDPSSLYCTTIFHSLRVWWKTHQNAQCTNNNIIHHLYIYAKDTIP